jgi:chromosomal replication initiation ATPase DnaA
MPDERQLPLELAHEPRFGEEDFLVGGSNADAYAMIDAWPDWPSRMLVLEGPTASGKSHLAAIWAERAGARRLAAQALSSADVPALAAVGAVVVEDIDDESLDESALFHLVNLAQESGAHLLLTTAKAPSGLAIGTADLASRLRRATLVAIEPPDDALIRAVIVKLFVDRQLIVDTALVEYLALRIERSFAAARAAVERLDRETLARRRRLTRPAAAEILGWSGES